MGCVTGINLDYLDNNTNATGIYHCCIWGVDENMADGIIVNGEGNQIVGCVIGGMGTERYGIRVVGAGSSGTYIAGNYIERDGQGSATGTVGVKLESEGNTVIGNFFLVHTPISIDSGNLDGNVILGNYDADDGANVSLPVQIHASVGIGTTNATQALDVFDEGNIVAHFKSTNQSYAMLHLENSSGVDAYVGATAHGLSLSGQGESSNHLVIDSGGAVGIGETSPGAKLDVNGDVKFSTQGVKIDAGTTNPTEIGVPGNVGDLYVHIDGITSNLYIKINTGNKDWGPCRT